MCVMGVLTLASSSCILSISQTCTRSTPLTSRRRVANGWAARSGWKHPPCRADLPAERDEFTDTQPCGSAAAVCRVSYWRLKPTCTRPVLRTKGPEFGSHATAFALCTKKIISATVPKRTTLTSRWQSKKWVSGSAITRIEDTLCTHAAGHAPQQCRPHVAPRPHCPWCTSQLPYAGRLYASMAATAVLRLKDVRTPHLQSSLAVSAFLCVLLKQRIAMPMTAEAHLTAKGMLLKQNCGDSAMR